MTLIYILLIVIIVGNILLVKADASGDLISMLNITPVVVLVVSVVVTPKPNTIESSIETPIILQKNLSGNNGYEAIFTTSDDSPSSYTDKSEIYLIEHGCREFEHTWGYNILGARVCRGYKLINNCVSINECNIYN